MNELYDKEIYAILGKYGHKEPHFNLITELSNYVAEKEAGAYESGYTHANNDWAFKADKSIVEALKKQEVKNDYRIITANTDVLYGDPEK